MITGQRCQAGTEIGSDAPEFHKYAKDPMILLSYVNTQLRDYYESLEALCTCRGLNRQNLLEKMDSIDYHYDEKTNQFI